MAIEKVFPGMYFHPVIHSRRRSFDLTGLRMFRILVRFGRGVFLCLWWLEGLLFLSRSRGRGEQGSGRNGAPAPQSRISLSARDLKRTLKVSPVAGFLACPPLWLRVVARKSADHQLDARA